MVGVAFICCTFVAKIKCQSNERFKTSYLGMGSVKLLLTAPLVEY